MTTIVEGVRRQLRKALVERDLMELERDRVAREKAELAAELRELRRAQRKRISGHCPYCGWRCAGYTCTRCRDLPALDRGAR